MKYLLSFFLLVSLHSFGQTPVRFKPMVKEGGAYPAFATTDLNDNKVSLVDAADKVIVLNFWFINCGPCRKEIPELNEIVAEHAGDSRIQFYAVALDTKEELQDYLQKNAFAYNIIPNGISIAQQYGVSGFPTNMVLAKGKVKFVSRGYGPTTIHQLKRAIKSALE